MITGYAISPQSSFTCPPTSIRVRNPEDKFYKRFTYCSTLSPKPKVLCFTEVSKNPSSKQDQIDTFSLDIQNTTSPIVYLGIINADQVNTGDISHTLIVVHQDGETICISGDLSQEYWNSNSGTVTGNQKEGLRVDFATILSVNQARRALLSGREDILALLETNLDSSTTSQAVPSLLILVTQNQILKMTTESNVLFFRLFSIGTGQAESADLSNTKRHRSIEEITSIELPTSYSSGHENTKMFLHERSGCLHQYWEKSLVIYNLNGLVAQIETHLDLEHEISSCIRLGSSLMALSSPSSMSIIDVRYTSLRASQSVSKALGKPIDLQVEEGKQQSPTGLRLLTYFSPLELVIGLQGRNLISYQLTGQISRNAPNRKRTREGLLIEALGRGLKDSKHKIAKPPKRTPPMAKSAKGGTPEKWQKKQNTLDAHVKIGDVMSFDKLMTAELQSSTPDVRSVKRTRILINYALSRIFKVENEQAGESANTGPSLGLKIMMFPPKTFDYLVKARRMTLQLIESALRETNGILTHVGLASNALIEALVVFDPSLEQLKHLFQGPDTYLRPQELVHAMSIGIRSIQKFETQGSMKLITNGEQSLYPDQEAALQVHVKTESVPTKPIVKTAKAIVKEAINRLYGYVEVDIRKALKQVLSRTELIAFVDILRTELADGGWLSRFVDAKLLPESSQANQNHQIVVVARLLNCAIDSLGTGGLILGSSTSYDMLDTGDTVSCMQAEVSAALEGIEEAAYLEGLLGEVLLYGRIAALPNPVKWSSNSIKVETITGDELGNALPLGMKPEKPISLTKIGPGGEIQWRSARELGRLRSQRVGKYSFERIFV